MVHGEHCIEVAERTGSEKAVGTVRAEAGQSLFVEALQERGDHVHLFAAMQSLIAVVGIETEHGDARCGDAKVAQQRGMQAAQLRFHSFGGDFGGHFAQREVGRDERNAHERVE